MWNFFKRERPVEYRVKETKLVQKHFDFLFEQGFSIIHAESPKHFNNWLIDLQSKSLRIQLAEDRSELIVRIGPKEATTGWHGSPFWHLQFFVFHLTNDFRSAPRWFYTKKMEEAAKILKDYFSQIENIILENDYQTLENDLAKAGNTFSRKWEPEIEKEMEQIVKKALGRIK